MSDKNISLEKENKSKFINIKDIPINKYSFKINIVNNKDIACIYYSSGTTSDPKGVIYSHNNIFI